ncbi:MAG: GRP family sugar transporter [Terriglobia bacterium]
MLKSSAKNSAKTGSHDAGLQRSLHGLGVMCGIAAGAWLGAAEAPVKLASAGLSPFVISLAMVAGVFVARWTAPAVLKGTTYVFLDLKERPHLAVWAVLAGTLWAIANTLTVYAIRDVGLSIAFPLWNTNTLVGLLWGWLFFGELRGAGLKNWAKVWGGAGAILVGATLLALASTHRTSSSGVPGGHAEAGIIAALGAGLLWGTMYIPYRKAYLSGMNPLSFVTVFTVGELGTMSTLALAFGGGFSPLMHALSLARASLFWLFLGGFCWVIGDLFQQYAAKYIGIGRGIPLSNTNQLWGLAWGALVFGELNGQPGITKLLVGGGTLVTIAGAIAISSALAPEEEQRSWQAATDRECERYGLDSEHAAAAMRGEDPLAGRNVADRRWDGWILAVAIAIFAALAWFAGKPMVLMNSTWMLALIALMLVLLFYCGWLLWKRTKFS